MVSARSTTWARPFGLAALLFSALYLLSDVVEALQGGFSLGQLWLTLIAEAAIPIFVIGLWAQRPAIGRTARLAAGAYAYSFVFFTGTVVYALVEGTGDYQALNDDLQPWMTMHGALMVIAGVTFGFAVFRTAVYPRWTGLTLMAGVILVAASQGMPEGVQVVAAGVRDLGFAGMGISLLRADRLAPVTTPLPRPALHPRG